MKTKILNFIRSIFQLKSFEILLVRLTQGMAFGSFLSKIPPNHYQYKKGTYRIANRKGINYQLDLSDIVDWFIYFGFTEQSRENLLELIAEGKTVIDIGANVGNVSLEAAQKVGSHGVIHAFEPDPNNYERLMRNLELNDFHNIIPNNLGLGHQAGEYIMATVAEGNQGMNRIVTKTGENHDLVQVQIGTLDSYVEEHQLNEVSLIKIDVEGFEFEVLKGGVQTLEKFRPTLFIELDDNNLVEQGSSAVELIQFLEKNSYAIVDAERNEKINSKFQFENCHFDIIAKP